MEKKYSQKAYIVKIKRLVESLERGKAFTIQVKGKRIRIPANSKISIEYEKDGKENELEFQIKW
jgi:amphi-Trp domain-containing protein